MSSQDCEWALTWHVDDFRALAGADLIGRLEMFQAWVEKRRELRIWPPDQAGALTGAAQCEGKRSGEASVLHLDFESMDPLGISGVLDLDRAAGTFSHPGGLVTRYRSGDDRSMISADLVISELSALVDSPNLLLTTPGWDATSQAIRGLIRSRDHLVIDACCDDEILCCAVTATAHVHMHAHVDIDDVRRQLARIRSRDRDNAILVVTSSLFASTSQVPDLEALREAARAFSAFVLVDVTNDLGIVMPCDRDLAHRCIAGNQADIVTGNLLPALTMDIGFISCRARAAATYLRWCRAGSRSGVGISAIQAARAYAALRLVRSAEGRERRMRLAENVSRLRSSLQESGLMPLGSPSWIASIAVDRDDVARLAFRRATALGTSVGLVESGHAVRSSGARLRLYASADHSPGALAAIGPVLARAIREARGEAARLSRTRRRGARSADGPAYVDI